MQKRKWVCRPAPDGTLDLIPIEDYHGSVRAHSHSIQEDTIPPTWHPMDGRMYDSKSAFRRTTKAYGGIEVGNDFKTKDGGFIQPRREGPKESVKETIIKTMQGYRADRHG